MTKKGFWTLRYTLLNAAYFAAFCTIHAYAAVYLLEHGFTNTEVGLLLALANIMSAITQPVIAGKIDKPGPLTNRRFILIAVTIIMVGSLLLIPSKNCKPLIFIIYAVIYMIQFAYQPVMTALCFEYQKAGCNINYGLARGLGSASFALASALVGIAVEKKGIAILIVINVISMIISAILAFTFIKPDGEKIGENDHDENVSNKQAHNNLFDFARTYPAFSVLLIGTVCFFFAHNMINDFMIQIIRYLGGGETELGYANFLQAILELPVMALIGLILKKFKSVDMIIFSGFGFFIKIFLLLFITGMSGMYLSQSFQLIAYALFIPSAAYYVSSTMEELDQVKGQAFVTSAITIGGVFSNLISGVILDHLGIWMMLLTGTIVCAVGVVIATLAMKKMPHYVTEGK
ncbi:MAG: MFS transporter [Lachnospiraceae bacterium]|nr:MFS transporter [Lachnospiraceae bacterium]